MKKTVVFLALILTLLAMPAKYVFAQEIAGQAATLAYHVADILPDSRVTRLSAFLGTYNSPLADEADTLVREAEKNNLDWKLVAAIAGVESTFCKQIPTGSNNCWGWGVFTGETDGVHFNNWADGIARVSEGLAKNYYGRGAQTVYDVGWMYAANGDSWGNHVRFFIDKIDAFTPVTPDQLVVSI